MEPRERDFFRTIREAILSNPFGRSRHELDILAAGVDQGVPGEDILERLVEKVRGMIGEVESRDAPLSAEDGRLLRHGKLFYIFHQFCDPLDEHIQAQIEKGEECCRLGCGDALLGMLAGHGFGDEESGRLVALFFQMRRAYYFIRQITGNAASVMDLRRALWNNVFTGDIQLYDDYLWDRMDDFSTMILGETGTGKGLAASAIGRSGFIPYDAAAGRFAESFARAFISINLSQFSEQLIESELFGHKKGAFTGAIDSHSGVFSRCSPCGAIFLDELGDVGVPVQIKLLQVLQSRTFTPVGSHRAERFGGRVIGATNRDLNALRQKGEFRDDFYYRLCSDVIEVPPLRKRLEEHPGELRALLAVTLRRIVGKDSAELGEKIHAYIERNQPPCYPWPGNIRELEQCTRRILLNGGYAWQQDQSPADVLAAKIEAGAMTAQQLLGEYCRMLHGRHATYEAVARLTGLDRRTVKKYIEMETVARLLA